MLPELSQPRRPPSCRHVPASHQRKIGRPAAMKLEKRTLQRPADKKKTTPETQRKFHQSQTQRKSVRLGYRGATRRCLRPKVAPKIQIPTSQKSPTSQ